MHSAAASRAFQPKKWQPHAFPEEDSSEKKRPELSNPRSGSHTHSRRRFIREEEKMGKESDRCCSSSVDSSNHPPEDALQDAGTDLALRLTRPHSEHSSSVSDSASSHSFCRRPRRSDCQPIKPLLRERIARDAEAQRNASMFVKVYMEGIPIGRKLNLCGMGGYYSLLETLRRMFKIAILRPAGALRSRGKQYVLTYEDEEGDWMLVGDIPWEMFLRTVRRLRITREDRC